VSVTELYEKLLRDQVIRISKRQMNKLMLYAEQRGITLDSQPVNSNSSGTLYYVMKKS
jgi:hypothetical protein